MRKFSRDIICYKYCKQNYYVNICIQNILFNLFQSDSFKKRNVYKSTYSVTKKKCIFITPITICNN